MSADAVHIQLGKPAGVFPERRGIDVMARLPRTLKDVAESLRVARPGQGIGKVPAVADEDQLSARPTARDVQQAHAVLIREEAVQ